MIELAVRHENSGVGSAILLADIKQLNPWTLPRQTLEGQLYVGKASELNLKTQIFLNLGGPLSVSSEFCLQSKSDYLLLKEFAMLNPIPCRNRRLSTAAALRDTARSRLCLQE